MLKFYYQSMLEQAERKVSAVKLLIFHTQDNTQRNMLRGLRDQYMREVVMYRRKTL